MRVRDQVALVCGGASGLGLSTVSALLERGARVVIFDLPGSNGVEVAQSLGTDVTFAEGDVRDESAVESAVNVATELGSLRVVINTAGIGGPLRIVDKEGMAGSLETFERIIAVNLVGTYNVLRHSAAAMARLEPLEEERGVCVLTSSIAAYDGRIGQVHYAASKAGVIGMVLPAARDLARKQIRVCAIAPGTFDTPLLGRLSDEIRAGLVEDIPHPHRLGKSDEYASLALQIIENPMLNGETIRLDGALRMTPR